MNGVRMAIEDANKQYAGQEFQTTMEFYDDEGVYDKGIVISHDIAEDRRVTAIYGTNQWHLKNYNISRQKFNRRAEIQANLTFTLRQTFTIFPQQLLQ